MIDPHPVTLAGHGVRLEPLEMSHAEALVAAAADGEIWKLWYVAAADLVADRAATYVEFALAEQRRGSQLPWVVRELATGHIVGSTRYHDIVRDIDRVEIGYTFYGQRWQRTHVNTACKLLLLEHAFETLGCRVVGFRVDDLNLRSQRAVEALGARKEACSATSSDDPTDPLVTHTCTASCWRSGPACASIWSCASSGTASVGEKEEGHHPTRRVTTMRPWPVASATTASSGSRKVKRTTAGRRPRPR